MIHKTTHSISRYLYNALQIQPQILVQITSNSYATELLLLFFFFVKLRLVWFGSAYLTAALGRLC